MSNYSLSDSAKKYSGVTGYTEVGKVDTSHCKLVLSKNKDGAISPYSAYLISPVDGESQYLKIHKGVMAAIVKTNEGNRWFDGATECITFEPKDLPMLHMSEEDTLACEKTYGDFRTPEDRAEGKGLYKVDFKLSASLLATATKGPIENTGTAAKLEAEALNVLSAVAV